MDITHRWPRHVISEGHGRGDALQVLLTNGQSGDGLGVLKQLKCRSFRSVAVGSKLSFLII